MARLVVEELVAWVLGLEVEIPLVLVIGVDSVQGLEHSRLARLVLADQARQVIDAEAAAVLDQFEVLDLGCPQTHSTYLMSCSRPPGSTIRHRQRGHNSHRLEPLGP